MNVVQIPGHSPIVQPQQRIKARGLALRKLSKSARALLVADIAEGTITLTDLSVRQLSAVAELSTGYARVALHMSSLERDKVRRGLRPLIVPKPPAAPLSPRERINQVIAEIGYDAALSMLVANSMDAAAAA